MKFLEKRVEDVFLGKEKELLWILEHNTVYTAGTSSNEKDLLDKKVRPIKTNRGGKYTIHSPGQKVIYFILKNKPNKVSSYLILYGVVRFIIEFFRNDPRGSFLTDFFSPSQELSLLFIITGFLYFKFLEKKRTTYPL